MPNFNALGQKYAKEGRYAQAIDAFSKGLEKTPLDSMLHYNRGLAYAQSGQVENALNDFRVSLRLAPEHPDTYGALATSYAVLGHCSVAYLYHQAVLEFGKPSQLVALARERTITLAPELEQDWLSQWLQTAREYNKDIIAKFGSMLAVMALEHGREIDLDTHQTAENMTDAVKVGMDMWGRKLKQLATYHSTNAFHLYQKRRYRAAIAQLIEALLLDSDGTGHLMMLAGIYSTLGADDPCLRVIDEIEKIESLDSEMATLKESILRRKASR